MPADRTERRLAAIVAADVAGYSRLMGTDEVRTVMSLRAHRRELTDPTIDAHRGRIVNTAGDSILAEFASVTDAVRWAVHVQRTMAERNADVAEDQRIIFRMGINVGDVIVEGTELYGDGVNIAARLEQLAEPGGVYVSRAVHDQVRDKVDLVFEDLGPREVKNIARPVDVFRVAWDGAPRAVAAAPTAAPAGRSMDARPGVAVLPFLNMSDDKEQEFFSDGLTEDLITDLSHFSQLRVIARNSTFRYKGQAVDLAQVGKELGVRYVLEGSVRRAGEQVRITAQLIDAQTQGHVWAQRYDRPQVQLFSVQDELTRAIVSTLVGNVLESDVKAAAAKAPQSLNAYELALLGRRYLRVASQADNLARAGDAFEQAIAVDPSYADAYRGLAQVFMSSGVLGLTWKGREQLEREAAFAHAERLLRTSIELHPRSELSHVALGTVLIMQGRYAEAVATTEHGVSLNPNSPEARVELGLACRSVGRHQEAVQQHEQALELDPFPSPRALCMGAWSLFMEKRYVAAQEAAERAVAASPRYRTPYMVLAATHAELGDLTRARAAMATVLELSPSYDVAEATRLGFLQHPADLARWIGAQRLAGLPESNEDNGRPRPPS